MSDISERELVRAPLAAADSLLNVFLAAHPGPREEDARVLLRAANVSEPAVVTITKAHRPSDMTPRYAVHLEAEGEGAFPIFDGSLSVEAGEDYNSFWLAVEGSYSPPGGLAGKMFDVLVGNRIAGEAARNLLIAMRDTAEATFARQEKNKPSSSSA